MKHKKNVLFLKVASTSPGGVNSRSNAMLSYLSEYYHITVCSIGGIRSPKSFLAVNPIDAFFRAISFVSYLRRFDVVVSFSLIPNLISSLVSTSSILSLTGSPFFTLDHTFLARLYWSFILEPISCFLADAIVPTSPSVLPPYISIFPYLRSKVQFIYGFIDTQGIDKSLASGLSEPLDLDFPYILFLGTLSKQKGILQLIEIFALMRNVEPSSDLKLIVCGDGPMLEMCLAQCAALDLQVSSHHHSLRSSYDVFFAAETENPYHYIVNSRLVVCPFYYEGLSNTMLESLYLKRPVLAAYNPSTIYLQEFLLCNTSVDSMSDGSLLHLLPFPTRKNYLQWTTALVALAATTFRPTDQYMDNILQFSASYNVLKWKTLIDSID